MNCKICLQDYNDSNHQPQIILPCCHTFCSYCIGHKMVDLSCPDCGNLIKERKTNTAILDALNHITRTEIQKNIKRIESNLKSFYIDYNLKLQENVDHLNQIDNEITNKVNQLVEIIFLNHNQLREQIKQCKIELNQQLSQILEADDELIKTRLDLIKSNQNNLESTKINKDLNEILQQINSKFNNLEQFKFEIKFKQNDLIVQNAENIVGQLVNESTLVETLHSDSIQKMTLDESTDIDSMEMMTSDQTRVFQK